MPADLVFLGARVERIAPGPPADAVAVQGGRITHVGSEREIRAEIDASTEVAQLEGASLLPGFQDAHVHPVSGGLLADLCDLHDLPDADAILAAIEAYARAHPEREWISGWGWSLTAFPNGEPSRELLDGVVGDRLAMLESSDGHVAWASSRALAAAGVTRETPDPPDGRIARDTDGEPSGTLMDGAIELVARLVPELTHEERLIGLRAAQAHLHALGITAWQDAHVEPEDLAVYQAAQKAGWLTARVVAALWWERERGMEQVEELEALCASVGPGRLRADSVKLMLDGILESRTALLTEPYQGSESGGAPFIEPKILLEAVPELDRRGFQAHFHAIGDGAVRLALDAVAEARRRNGRSDTRPHISHIEVIHPADVPRFGALGTVANMQPFWASDDDQMQGLRIPALGPHRAHWQYVFASLRRAGARLAGGSDWTVTTANALLEIEVAVNRVSPSARGSAAFLPEECLTLDEALEAFTLGSAYVNHLDRDTGTIEVGKLADLVVLDRDLRASDEPIGEARVRETYVEGERVYSMPGGGVRS